MLIAAKVLAGLVLLIHVYIFLLETVLFDSRGRKVACGFLLPDAATGRAFTIYGLVCVAVAGIWGALTVQMRILFVQTVPAVLALAALLLA